MADWPPADPLSGRTTEETHWPDPCGHNPVWRQDHAPGKKSAYCLPDERAPPTPVQVGGKENVRIPSVHWRGNSAHSATRKGKHQQQQNRRVFRYSHDASPSDAGVGSVTDD